MKIYIVCPVNDGTPDIIFDYVKQLEEDGHIVHFPPRDVNQNDETGGYEITKSHLAAMKLCDRVDIFYNETSGGSKVDIGMALALNKDIKLVEVLVEKPEKAKSYLKVIKKYIENKF